MRKRAILLLFTVSQVWLLMIIPSTSIIFLENVHAADSFHGIITSSATWTKGNSPYTLDGPTAIARDVTITIEPGVTVNLNGFYIEVNGTLIAKGTDSEKIYFNNGVISYTNVANGWNEQTGSGSIFENTVTEALQTSTSLKITKNTISELAAAGSSIVTDNTIRSFSAGGTATVMNNEITETCSVGESAQVKSNNIDARVIFRGGANTEVSNNNISDGIHCDTRGGYITIANNEIRNKNGYPMIFINGPEAYITNNRLIGNNRPEGMRITGSFHSSFTTKATITQNQITECTTGIKVSTCYAEITRNAIYNNDLGMHVSAISSYNLPPPGTNIMTIEHNTIAQNAIGIEYYYSEASATFTYNNIEDNSDFNFKITSADDVNVPNNWWGTTDTEQINDKIYDQDWDFNLGEVNFNPILTSPVTQTTPIPEATPTATPPPTPTGTPTPTSTPYHEPQQTEQLETIAGAIILVIVLSAGIGLLIYLIRRK